MEENNKKESRFDIIIGYLKKIFKIEKLSFVIKTIFYTITGLAGIVGTVYAIKSYNLSKSQIESVETKSEIELLRDSVLEKIKYIEGNFHPEKIPYALDTIKYYDIYQIREFQRISLELAAIWRDIDNIPNSYDLDLRTSKALEEIMQNFGNKLMLMLELKYGDLLGTMMKLNAYGDSTMQPYYLIDTAKYLKTLESSNEDAQLEKEYNEAHDKFGELLEKYELTINNTDDIPEDLFEAEKRYFSLEEKKYHSKRAYKSDNNFFNFIIQQNNQYSIPLKRYFLSTANQQ